MNTLPSPQKVASTYMGNPAPLQQKVQQAGQQPNGLPNDFLDAIALSMVQDQQQRAKNAMMMRQQLPQGTVMDRIKQQVVGAEKDKLMAAMQPQGIAAAAPQQAPQPQGGGIDQLQSGVGQNFAGGGIVAFDDGGATNKDKNADDEPRNPLAVLNPGDMLDAIRRWRASGKPLAEYWGIPTTTQRPAAAAPAEMPVPDGIATPNAEIMRMHRPPDADAAAPMPTPPVPTGIAGRVSSGVRMPYANLNPKLEEDQFTKDEQDQIRKLWATDPEAARQKQADWFKKQVGADALLQEQRANEEKAMDLRRAAEQHRSPWNEYVRSALAADPRKGIAFTGAAGTLGLGDARAKWAGEDVTNQEAYNKGIAGILKQQIEANTGAANAGTDAAKSANSLIAAGVTAGAQESTRLENAKARILQAQIHANEMAMRHSEMLSNKEQALAARTHDLAMRQATDASTKFANDIAAGITHPGVTADDVFWNTYNRAMATVPGFQPIAAPKSSDKGPDLSKWGQPKLKQ